MIFLNDDLLKERDLETTFPEVFFHTGNGCMKLFSIVFNCDCFK